jgi:hypothetical protein
MTAGLLALSLGLGGVTASATPARANNDEVVAIIGGLIALYAIGQAIQQHNRSDNRSRATPHRPRPQPLIAPARCFIEGQDRNGYFRGYVRRCMQNNVARPAALPNQCLRRVETHRGPRMIYGGRCLFQNGWRREAGFRP